MALKGFLASGFQQLIGASRLKGANTQWIGEPNRQTMTVVSNQITNSLYYGENILEYNGSGFTPSGALFSSTPTFPCMLTIINDGTGVIRLSNVGVVAGSCKFTQELNIQPSTTARLFYDVLNARWRLIHSDFFPYAITSVAVPNGATNITLATFKSDKSLVQISPSTASVVANLTYASPSYSSNPAGQVVILAGSSIGSTEIKLVQDVNNTTTNGFLINGDFTFTDYSNITLIYDGLKWIEIARTVLSY